MSGTGRPPRSDAEWARSVIQRLAKLENLSDIRIGPWVITAKGDTLMAYRPGDSFDLRSPPTEAVAAAVSTDLFEVAMLRACIRDYIANLTQNIDWLSPGWIQAALAWTTHFLACLRDWFLQVLKNLTNLDTAEIRQFIIDLLGIFNFPTLREAWDTFFGTWSGISWLGGSGSGGFLTQPFQTLHTAFMALVDFIRSGSDWSIAAVSTVLGVEPPGFLALDVLRDCWADFNATWDGIDWFGGSAPLWVDLHTGWMAIVSLIRCTFAWGQTVFSNLTGIELDMGFLALDDIRACWSTFDTGWAAIEWIGGSEPVWVDLHTAWKLIVDLVRCTVQWSLTVVQNITGIDLANGIFAFDELRACWTTFDAGWSAIEWAGGSEPVWVDVHTAWKLLIDLSRCVVQWGLSVFQNITGIDLAHSWLALNDLRACWQSFNTTWEGINWGSLDGIWTGLVAVLDLAKCSLTWAVTVVLNLAGIDLGTVHDALDLDTIRGCFTTCASTLTAINWTQPGALMAAIGALIKFTQCAGNWFLGVAEALISWDGSVLHNMFSSVNSFIEGVIEYFFGSGDLANWRDALDFLAGIVGAAPWDAIKKIYGLWKSLVDNVIGDSPLALLATFIAAIRDNFDDILNNPFFVHLRAFLADVDFMSSGFDLTEAVEAFISLILMPLDLLFPQVDWQDFLDQIKGGSGGTIQTLLDRIQHLSLTGLFDVAHFDLTNKGTSILQRLNSTTGLFDASAGFDNVGSSLLRKLNISTGLYDSSAGFDNVESSLLRKLNISTGLYDSSAGFDNLASSIFKRLDSAGNFAADYLTGTAPTGVIPGLAASKIISGTFDALRIPSLDASKIGSGTFGTGLIPALSTAWITSGTFDTARIPALAVSWITGLTDRIQYLDTWGGFNADALNTGTVPNDRLSNIGIDKIYQLGSYIQNLNTSGNITTAAAIPNLSASKIVSDILNIARIPTSDLTRNNIADLGQAYGACADAYGSGGRMYRSSSTRVSLSANSGPYLLPTSFFDYDAESPSADLTRDITNAKYTVSKAGWYACEICYKVANNFGGIWNISPVLFVNGSAYKYGPDGVSFNYLTFGVNAERLAHTFLVRLSANDYVQAGYDASNATGTITNVLQGGDAAQCYFGISLMNRQVT